MGARSGGAGMHALAEEHVGAILMPSPEVAETRNLSDLCVSKWANPPFACGGALSTKKPKGKMPETHLVYWSTVVEQKTQRGRSPV